MPEFRILWTALPRSADATHLFVDAFFSPRLGTDTPGALLALSDFPTFLDWPSQVAAHLTFDVELDDGAATTTVAATRLPADAEGDLRSDAWLHLFPPTTPVVGWKLADPTSRPIYSYPAAQVTAYLRDTYRDIGRRPSSDLPDEAVLEEVRRDLGDLIDTRVAAERARPSEQVTGGETTGGDTRPVARGCLPGCLTGCLTAPLAMVVWVLRWLRHRLLGGPSPASMPGGGGGTSTTTTPIHVTPKVVTYTIPPPGPAPVPPALAAVEAHVAVHGVTPPAGWVPPGGGVKAHSVAMAALMRFYGRPESEPPPAAAPDINLVPPRPAVPDWDFHQRLGPLGDYPVLTRRLGIVVRLRIDRPAAAPTTVRVVPRWDGVALPDRDVTPRTRCRLDGDRFTPAVREGSDLRGGMLDLGGADDRLVSVAGKRFDVVTVDTDGAALKLIQAAASFERWKQHKALGLVSPKSRKESVAALRSTGIAVVRVDRAAVLRDRLLASAGLTGLTAPAPPPAAPSELLDADDVVRGFRVEVQDVTGGAEGPWLSLCRRVGTYRFVGLAGPAVAPMVIEDSGFVSRSAATSKDQTTPLYVHEAVVRWTGWSLVAPHPAQAIIPLRGTRADGTRTVPTQDEGWAPPGGEHAEEMRLATRFKPVAHSLPALRFGHAYRLRMPWVDLSGEGAVLAADPPASEPVVFRRFETALPPALLPTGEFSAGESLERAVIRSDVDRTAAAWLLDVPPALPDAAWYTSSTTRHVIPERAAQILAEQHGKLDAAIGSVNPADLTAGRALSEREEKDVLDPSFGMPAQGAIAGTTRTFALNRLDGTLTVPYLPDPIAAGVALQGVPGANALAAGAELRAGVDPGTGRVVCHAPFGGAWPDLQTFRLRLADRPGTVEPVTGKETFLNADDPPLWDPATRLLTVFLAKAASARITLGTYVDPDDLDLLGVWDWLDDGAAGGDLQKQVSLGVHWMVSPPRTLTVVHAVQRPLGLAALTAAAATKAKLGETSVVVTGTMGLHVASTGQVELLAEWKEVVDTPGTPLVVRKGHSAALGGFRVADPLPGAAGGSAAFPPPIPAGESVAPPVARHELGDTRHYRVDYRLAASTRFREYFPATLAGARQADGSDGFSRVGNHFSVSVLNSASPVPPVLRLTVPSFGWQGADPTPPAAWTTFERRRVGGGLRVFLDRPWFASGEGELLGVVIAPPGSNVPPTRRSQVGVDPTWAGPQSSTFDLSATLLRGARRSEAGVALVEDGAQAVTVVGYEPVFDPERDQWYADVAVDMQALPDTYWPFVRLAVVRYQPESLVGAKISKVVLTEFSQLLPDRRLTVDVAATTVTATVRGRAPSSEKPNVVTFQLQEAPGVGADPDELDWRPVGSTQPVPIIGQWGAGVDGVPDAEGLAWSHQLTFSGDRSAPLRLVVREHEFHPADQESVNERFGSKADASHLMRVVYADAVRLG